MNVGIATGTPSGFFVLDVDGPIGEQSLAQLVAKHGPLPLTAQQQTGSGGSHYLFKLPGYPVTNSAGRLGRGLDIRGDGGQIVVSPSRSARGPYRWVHRPWDVPPAEAPAWLLTELRRAPATRPAPTDRGYFPPASPAVLDEAREALEQHGPAVDGDGGGLHTVHAAAILTHDFALTDDEAWPLFLGWNATCEPPWEPDELRVRLERGRKYGKLAYGCRRAIDAVEAARKLVADWQAAGAQEATMLDVIAKCRPLAALSADPSRHALIFKALHEATGLSAKALALPKPNPPSTPLKQGEIRCSTDLHRVADEAERAIAPHVFSRNGVLCEVVHAERTWIAELEPPRIIDLMSQSAVFVQNDEQKGIRTTAPPPTVASILHSRRSHPGVRVLEAVTTAPVFLADGNILQDRGYNEQARVFLEPNVTVWVPDSPTLEDARAAVRLFRELVSDFTFASRADFSSWLCAVLTPLVKAATGNAPSPLICISASSPGAGKTLLTELAAAIVTGGSAQVRPYTPKDASEWPKKITAFVKAASPISVFDNVNGAIGDAHLDQLITASTWSDRQLGASDAPPLPNVTTWLATGNNIEPHGDTVRRVLMVRLEVLTERPAERTGFKHPLLVEYALQRRSELLGAALTLLRAYHVAGRPEQPLPAWGSFPAWSALVRAALVWVGAADPYLTQKRAQDELNEPEHDAHDFWLSVVGASDGLASSIALLANQRDAQSVLGLRESMTPLHLRRFINRFVDKPRAGRWIRRRRDGAQNQTVYVVEAVP
jgi:hypothetical protein